MKTKTFTTRDIVISGVLAAIYVGITLLSANISYYGIQFRISEALLLIIFLDKKYAVGVLLGTFIANLFGPFGLLDAVFGTLASTVAVLLMILYIKNRDSSLRTMTIAGFFPTVINAIYVPLILAYMDSEISLSAYLPISLSVAAGEFCVVCVLGPALFNTYINRIKK